MTKLELKPFSFESNDLHLYHTAFLNGHFSNSYYNKNEFLLTIKETYVNQRVLENIKHYSQTALGYVFSCTGPNVRSYKDSYFIPEMKA